MNVVGAVWRWLRQLGRGHRQWSDIRHWADDRHFAWRPSRGEPGFVIDGRLGAVPWRLEWGPSKRGYIAGSELRLRAKVATGRDLQVLLMTRELQQRLEAEVFDQFVGDLQTRLDTSTPAEVRWLVMYPVMTGLDADPLGERWSAVSNARQWLLAWLDGGLGKALAGLDDDDVPAVALVINRGRCTLRVQVDDPGVDVIERWLRVFESGLRQARRSTGGRPVVVEPEITQPGLFVPSVLPQPRQAEVH